VADEFRCDICSVDCIIINKKLALGLRKNIDIGFSRDEKKEEKSYSLHLRLDRSTSPWVGYRVGLAI